MEFENVGNRSTAGVVRHSCGILFVLFSFCYLFFLQGDLIAKAQYVFSEGATSYSIFWGAVIITAVLRLIQWPVAHFVKVPLRFYAITYMPSVMILTIICDVNSEVMSKFTLGWWWLGIPLCLGFFYLAVRVLSNLESYTYGADRRSVRMSPYLWPNFAILVVILLWCGTCHSASDVDMYEQKVERLVEEGRYDEALEVGRESQDTNIRLSNLRMFALSKTGQLPDKLFFYPQNYGCQGLLEVSDTSSRCYRVDASDICRYLGVECDSTVRTTEDYFNKVVFHQSLIADSLMSIEVARSENPDSLALEIQNRYALLKEEKRRIDDYILCGLLLERNLDKFKEKIDETYALHLNTDSVARVDSLPEVYREALVMICPEVNDTLMIKRYAAYLDMKESIPDSVESSNRTYFQRIEKDNKKRFGNTFWWYYYNPVQKR